MRAVLQRVASASVVVDGAVTGAIDVPGLLVYLDGLTDTENVGAIFRTAAALGVDGVIAGPTSAEWYGINQYFFYTLSSCYKAGLRLEWFDDADGARVLGSTGSTNYYSITAGLNYTPNANIMIRPEIRYDWANGSTPFNPNAAGVGTDADCMYYGADFILIY